ncbi:hypothetical protein FS749_008408 [Ceratobasidium sp. UAMH 11750]|nr:hypothetical protein FS749_008408 [Ceratobasidium sp. UAMH 11750]
MRILLEAEEAECINVLLPPATVTAIGVVKSVVERSWFLEVGFRDWVLQSASQKTFNVGITVPNTKRFAKLNPPKLERLLSVRGTLASISVHEEIAGIELESMTFISMGSGSSGASTIANTVIGGRSKRQFYAERTVSPVKKVKAGLTSAFIGEDAVKDLISAEK